MPESMHDYVIRKLEGAKGRWSDVSFGSGVPKRTLEKIARREIADPGVSHIQRLWDYFIAEDARAQLRGSAH